MRNLKKVLALVLAFSMMLSVVAFASYPDVPADADYADAVELLSALDIIKGDDLGNFNPDNTITRAEYAAIVCRALGLENSANGAAGATAFVDVAADHWASGYINLATQNGIINGYGDGNFGPEDKVTYEQAVKMLVCALGFEPMASQKGGYPTGYLVVANSYKITSGVTATVEAPRKTVAKLVYNALSTPKMDQTSYGVNAEWQVLDGKNDRDYATLLTDMDIYIASGIVGTKDVAEDTVEFSVREASDDYEFGISGEDKKSDGFAGLYDPDQYDLTLEINGSNISFYETQYVDVYVQKDSRGDYYVLAVVPSAMGDTLTILSDDIKAVDDNKIEYYVDGTSKTKTIKVASTVAYSLNKGLETSLDYDVEDLETLADDIELKFVENTGDSSFDMIIATNYASERVYDIDVDGSRIKFGNKWLEIDYDDDSIEYIFQDADGAELELADFEEDDVVAVVANDKDYTDADYLRIIKLTDNAVTGTVTETATQSGRNYVWIDGEKYETYYNLKNEDEGTFYISMTGKIFDFEGSSSIGNYAYVLEAAKDSNKSFSKAVWELKLLTVEGGVAEYTMTEDASNDFEAKKYDTDDDDEADASLAVLMGITDNEWLFTDADNRSEIDNAARLIAFKTNSKGEIKYIELVEVDDDDAKIVTVSKDEYNSKTMKLSGLTMEDDTVIFNVDVSKADSAYTTDINYLVDDGEYAGLAIKVDNEVKLLLVTDGAAKLSDEVGFAIVTEKKDTTVDGEDLVIVELLQDMETITVTFNEDSEIIGGTEDIAAEDLDIGDVIMVNADGDGIVTTYAVLGQINSKGLLDVYEDTLLAFSVDNEFVYGYIASEDGGKSKKYENVEVGGVVDGDGKTITLSVDSNTNTYSYFNAGRNLEIKTSYITEDADWYKEGSTDAKDEATFFFARIVDDAVVDIYTFNERIVGATNIATEAENAIYVNCADNEVVEGEEVEVTPSDEDVAKVVIDAIAAIGTVTTDSEAAIKAAEEAYAALTDAQKALVTNYSTLTDARAAYDALVQVQGDIEEVEEEVEVETVVID